MNIEHYSVTTIAFRFELSQAQVLALLTDPKPFLAELQDAYFVATGDPRARPIASEPAVSSNGHAPAQTAAAKHARRPPVRTAAHTGGKANGKAHKAKTSAMVACPACGAEFHARGLAIHQAKCAKYRALLLAEIRGGAPEVSGHSTE